MIVIVHHTVLRAFFLLITCILHYIMMTSHPVVRLVPVFGENEGEFRRFHTCM